MNKVEFRAVIRLFFLERKTAKEIPERIEPTLVDSCLSNETVRLWLNAFKQDKASAEGAPRPGTIKSAMKPDNIDNVHDIMNHTWKHCAHEGYCVCSL